MLRGKMSPFSYNLISPSLGLITFYHLGEFWIESVSAQLELVSCQITVLLALLSAHRIIIPLVDIGA